MSADCPIVVEACTDPEVPPLPPHVEFKQAKAYTSALAKGDPEAGGIIKQLAKEFVEGLIPSLRDKD